MHGQVTNYSVHIEIIIMLQNLTKTLQHTDLLVPLADLPGELALLELRGALLVDVGEAQLGLQLPER